MWREFLFKMGRSKRPSVSCSSNNSDESEEESCDSDSSGVSGHYSFRTQQTSSEPGHSRFGSQRFPRIISSHGTTMSLVIDPVVDESSSGWREKFEFTLSLIREPRYLLAETLVAEQLKLTLKQQAYRLEQLLLHQTIEERRQEKIGSESSSSTSSNPRYVNFEFIHLLFY